MKRIDVPVKIGSFGLVVAAVEVNGKGPFDFVVDTGTGRTVVAKELAASIGISATRTDELMTASAPLQVQVGRADLGVGGLRLEGADVTLADLAALQAAGLEVDGLLGVDFLGSYAVGFDHASSVMTLERDRPAAEGAIPFELAPRKPLVMIDAHIGDAGPYRFGLDTGAVTSMLSTEVADACGLAERVAAEGVGGSGSFALETARAAVTVADQGPLELTVGITPMGHLTEAVGTQLDGLLGLNFLRLRRVTIDYPNRQVILSIVRTAERSRGTSPQRLHAG